MISNPKPVIMIGTPHGRTGFVPEYIDSLARTYQELGSQYNIRLVMKETCYVHLNRNWIFKKAYDHKPDWLLWIDSDMKWTPQDIMHLIAERQHAITGVYYKRTVPVTSTIYKVQGKENGKFLSAVVDFPNAPFEIDAAGMGFMLLSYAAVKTVFENIKTLGYPFDPMVGRDTQQDARDGTLQTELFGEDLSFCWRMQKSGIKLYCHPGVMLGHIGAINMIAPLGRTPKGLDDAVYRKLRDWPFTYSEGSLFNNTDQRRDAQLDFLAAVFKVVKPKRVLETGTYKGHFAYWAKKTFPEIRAIYTFDQYELCGKVVDYLNTLFQEQGVSDHGAYPSTGPIYFFPGDTKKTIETHAPMVPRQWVIDLAWIDGGHDYETASSDIKNCARLQIPHILVDDYFLYPAVRKAVFDFLQNDAKYVMVKTSDFKIDNRGIAYLKRKD